MDFGLEGRRALVIASSKGIGKAIAMGLARERMLVTINGRKEQPLEMTREEIALATGAMVFAVRADVSKTDEVQDMVKQAIQLMGGLDVLVTNAGGPVAGGFFDLEDSDWERAFQTNLMSAVRAIRVAVPYLKESGQGRIVNLQSLGAKQPVPYVTLTNCIRAAIFGLNKELADTLGKDNITVNTVLAGPVPTERLDYLLSYRARKLNLSIEEMWQQALAGVPMGRFGTPEDVAAMCIFLASRPAGWITGTVIQVDGGRCRAAL